MFQTPSGTRIDTVVATATADRTTLNAAVTSESAARVGADTALGSRVDTVSATVAGKADASAVNSLTTRVTTAEGTITSQGGLITGLNNGLEISLNEFWNADMGRRRSAPD